MINWNNAKQDFITGEYTCREIAEKYGCSRQTVLTHCRKENWVQAREETAEQNAITLNEHRTTVLCSVLNCYQTAIDELQNRLDNAEKLTVNEITDIVRAVDRIGRTYGIKTPDEQQEQRNRIELQEIQLKKARIQEQEELKNRFFMHCLNKALNQTPKKDGETLKATVNRVLQTPIDTSPETINEFIENELAFIGE